jgi:hypothetical protein
MKELNKILLLVSNRVNTLLTALDALCSALISATITGGAFSAGTIIALINAKAEIDAILK